MKKVLLGNNTGYLIPIKDVIQKLSQVMNLSENTKITSISDWNDMVTVSYDDTPEKRINDYIIRDRENEKTAEFTDRQFCNLFNVNIDLDNSFLCLRMKVKRGNKLYHSFTRINQQRNEEEYLFFSEDDRRGETMVEIKE